MLSLHKALHRLTVILRLRPNSTCRSVRLTLAHFSNSLIEHSGHSPRCPSLLTKLYSLMGLSSLLEILHAPFLPQGLCPDYPHRLKCRPSMSSWSFLSFHFSHSTFHSPKLLFLFLLPVCYPSALVRIQAARDWRSCLLRLWRPEHILHIAVADLMNILQGTRFYRWGDRRSSLSNFTELWISSHSYNQSFGVFLKY